LLFICWRPESQILKSLSENAQALMTGLML